MIGIPIPLQNCFLIQSQIDKKTDKSNWQIKIPQDPSCNQYWIPDIDKECRQTKGAFDHTGADALHCRHCKTESKEILRNRE